MELQVEKTVYSGRPAVRRSEAEESIYDVLEKLKIRFQRVDHGCADSIPLCYEIEKLLNAPICKNLFLCNARKTKFYLLLLPGSKKYEAKDLSKQIQSSRLSFAPPEYMASLLGTTPGSVSILELIHDTSRQITLLIDGELLENESIGCHPGINTSTLKIKTDDLLEKFLAFTGHSYKIVNL